MTDHRFDDLYIAPNSESQARADRLLPNKGSEDASSILGDWQPSTEPEDYDRKEFLPDENVEWVITVEFPDGRAVNAVQLKDCFNGAYRDEYGPCSLYGRDASTGFWTFLVSADGPKEVTGLKVAYDYNRTWDAEFSPATAKEYESRFRAVTRVAKQEIGDVIVSATRPAEDAAQRAKSLASLSDKYDQTVAFYLVADHGNEFQGRDIWDVMLCLGLNWGDMDCFHWTNPGGNGDDSFFSVETSTAPGYFLPEQIAGDRLQTTDLVFIFSVPRTCEPTEVAKRMDLAVKYCQKRLGGNIHYTLNDQELPLTELISRIDQMSSELKELGFEPGTGSALRMF